MLLWAYLAMMLGVVSPFLDGREQVVTMALCLLCGVAYVVTMRRKYDRENPR